MEIIISQPDLQQDCLDKLSRALDLVLKTAEAASAQNDHKVVIQSAREVTRLAALMHKMTSSATKAGRAGMAGGKTAEVLCPGKENFLPAGGNREGSSRRRTGKTDINPEDFIMPDLETLFTPVEMACWDGLPDNLFGKFSENYRELQTMGKEMAADLLAANQAGRAAD